MTRIMAQGAVASRLLPGRLEVHAWAHRVTHIAMERTSPIGIERPSTPQ